MFDRLLRRKSPPPRAEDPGLPEVSQPFPSADAPAPARPRVLLDDRTEGLSVTELSELGWVWEYHAHDGWGWRHRTYGWLGGWH